MLRWSLPNQSSCESLRLPDSSYSMESSGWGIEAWAMFSFLVGHGIIDVVIKYIWLSFPGVVEGLCQSSCSCLLCLSCDRNQMTCTRQNVKSDEPQQLCSNQWDKLQWPLRTWDWGQSFRFLFNCVSLLSSLGKGFCGLHEINQLVSSICKVFCSAKRWEPTGKLFAQLPRMVEIWSLTADQQARMGPQCFSSEVFSFPNHLQTAVSFPFLWNSQKRQLFVVEEQIWVLCFDCLLKEKELGWIGLPQPAPHRPELTDTQTVWVSPG